MVYLKHCTYTGIWNLIFNICTCNVCNINVTYWCANPEMITNKLLEFLSRIIINGSIFFRVVLMSMQILTGSMWQFEQGGRSCIMMQNGEFLSVTHHICVESFSAVWSHIQMSFWTGEDSSVFDYYAFIVLAMENCVCMFVNKRVTVKTLWLNNLNIKRFFWRKGKHTCKIWITK